MNVETGNLTYGHSMDSNKSSDSNQSWVNSRQMFDAITTTQVTIRINQSTERERERGRKCGWGGSGWKGLGKQSLLYSVQTALYLYGDVQLPS